MAKYKNIFKAIEANDIEAVKTFLPEQLEARDSGGWTPLNWACVRGYIEIVRLLLVYGADIEARNNNGCTPLHYAWYYACRYGHTEIALLLMDNGADIEARDCYDRTIMHLICIHEKYKMLEFLVSRGADPMAKNCWKQSVLDLDAHAIKDDNGKEIPHKEILIQLRAEYLNKRALDAAETTAALSSGWEMEM